MDFREWLIEGFDYDLWANGMWLDHYPQMPEPNQAEGVLTHILWALETWLSRGEPGFTVQEESFRSRLDRVSAEWKVCLQSRDYAETIHYRNTKGREFDLQLGAIALHVINHGTYHRGQLRGIAAEQGDESFPDTDLGGFFLRNGLYGGQTGG